VYESTVPDLNQPETAAHVLTHLLISAFIELDFALATAVLMVADEPSWQRATRLRAVRNEIAALIFDVGRMPSLCTITHAPGNPDGPVEDAFDWFWC
jgi:hypothetical protein